MRQAGARCGWPVDLVYALSDRILDIYLLDAAAEIGLIVLWGVVSLRR